jgi:hypothetical protein
MLRSFIKKHESSLSIEHPRLIIEYVAIPEKKLKTP